MFFKKDRNSLETLSSLRVRVPTIINEELVGNLGAPLRSTFTSDDPRSSESTYTTLGTGSGSSLRQRRRHRNRGKARADPLLDWDVDDLDDEDLEDMEIESRRPMYVGLQIDPNMRGEGSGGPVWRKGFDGIGAGGEEAMPFVTRSESISSAQTPIRSVPPKSDRSSLPPSRHPSKSTVEEGDALLVYADENEEEPDSGHSMGPFRPSLASTVESEDREVIPRRTSYF